MSDYCFYGFTTGDVGRVVELEPNQRGWRIRNKLHSDPDKLYSPRRGRWCVEDDTYTDKKTGETYPTIKFWEAAQKGQGDADALEKARGALADKLGAGSFADWVKDKNRGRPRNTETKSSSKSSSAKRRKVEDPTIRTLPKNADRIETYRTLDDTEAIIFIEATTYTDKDKMHVPYMPLKEADGKFIREIDFKLTEYDAETHKFVVGRKPHPPDCEFWKDKNSGKCDCKGINAVYLPQGFSALKAAREKADSLLVWAEGGKSVDAAVKVFPDAVAFGTIGGKGNIAAHKADFEKLHGFARVLVLSDYGAETEAVGALGEIMKIAGIPDGDVLVWPKKTPDGRECREEVRGELKEGLDIADLLEPKEKLRNGRTGRGMSPEAVREFVEANAVAAGDAMKRISAAAGAEAFMTKKFPELTEKAAAERVIAKHADRLLGVVSADTAGEKAGVLENLYCSEADGLWRPVEGLKFELIHKTENAMIKRELAARKDAFDDPDAEKVRKSQVSELGRWRKRIGSHAGLKNILNLLHDAMRSFEKTDKKKRRLLIDANDIDAAEGCFGFDGQGVWDAFAGGLLTGLDARKRKVVTTTNCRYDPGVEDDKLYKVIGLRRNEKGELEKWENPLWDNDENFEYWQNEQALQFFGFSARGRINFIVGETSGGKSTLFNINRLAFGKDYCPDGLEDIIVRKDFHNDKNPHDLDLGKPARQTSISEMEEGYKLNYKKLKIITGERVIKVRALHRNPVELRTTATLNVAVNEDSLPVLGVGQPAVNRRVVILKGPRRLEAHEMDDGLQDYFANTERAKSAVFNYYAERMLALVEQAKENLRERAAMKEQDGGGSKAGEFSREEIIAELRQIVPEPKSSQEWKTRLIGQEVDDRVQVIADSIEFTEDERDMLPSDYVYALMLDARGRHIVNDWATKFPGETTRNGVKKFVVQHFPKIKHGCDYKQVIPGKAGEMFCLHKPGDTKYRPWGWVGVKLQDDVLERLKSSLTETE